MLRLFISKQDGVAPLILLMIAMLCALGVLGFDFSRAHAVKARLQTAADAASLAGALAGARMPQAQKPEYEYVFVDGHGNETTDPNQAVAVKAKIVGWHIDLQDPAVRAEAQRAAREAFVKNLLGTKSPVRDVACPNLEGLPNPTPGYAFEADVDWSKPKYTKDGSVYYDEFKVSRTDVGVRSFLLTKLFRMFKGEDVFDRLTKAPIPPDSKWSGAIYLRTASSAQALYPQKKN